MRFLRRRDEPTAWTSYEPFWVWWSAARDRIARAIEEQRIFAMCRDAARARDVAEGWARAERRFGPSIDVRPGPGWKFREELGL